MGVAVKRLVDLMMGELKGPDGELVPGQDAVQMRLAMNSILNRAGVMDALMGDEEVGRVEITEIRILDQNGRDEVEKLRKARGLDDE